jgi:hypothetical protein
MPISNPGPASATNPNSIMANFVGSGTSTLYTFATLPAASNFTVGFLAETSDQGMCHVVLVSGVLTWAVLGIPQSAGALQRLVSPVGMTAISAYGQASLSLQYLEAQWPVSASRVDLIVGWAAASSAGAETGAIVITAIAGIYSNSASTLTRLSSGSTQTTYTYASNSAGNTGLITSGLRPISVPMNVSMTPGEYVVGFAFSTNSSSVGTATTNLAQTVSVYGWASNQSALNYAEFTAATNASTNLLGVLGMYSAATTAMPASIAVTDVNQTGVNQSKAQFAFVMRNY